MADKYSFHYLRGCIGYRVNINKAVKASRGVKIPAIISDVFFKRNGNKEVIRCKIKLMDMGTSIELAPDSIEIL